MKIQEEMLQCLEAVAALTGRMVDAARRDDWDVVMGLQDEYRTRVETLRDCDRAMQLDEPSRQHHHELIQRILADDATVRDLANPQLARLQALLAAGRQRRALQDMYGLG
jgi:flagellar protein FliT